MAFVLNWNFLNNRVKYLVIYMNAYEHIHVYCMCISFFQMPRIIEWIKTIFGYMSILHVRNSKSFRAL